MKKQKNSSDRRDDDEAKAKKTYPADESITAENASAEAAKAMREVRDFFRSLTVTPAGRIRTTAYTRGGAVEDIRRVLQSLAGINAAKEKKKAKTSQSTKEEFGNKAFAGSDADNKESGSLPA